MGISNNLMFQWLSEDANGATKQVTYPIAMNTLYACFICPHINASSIVYWNDFGYNVTNTTVEIRCCNHDNILIIGI